MMGRWREGTLSLETKVAWRRTLEALRRGLEPVIARCPDPLVAGVWREVRRVVPLPDPTLCALDDVPSWPACDPDDLLSLVERVRADDEPPALLGACFGLDSSTCIALPVEGPCQKRAGAAGSLHPDVDPIIDVLDELPPRAIDVVAAISRDVIATMVRIADALSSTSERPIRARDVNQDAGNHVVTTDPRELVAAVDGGLRTWRAFPYYAARFAERGERFTRSDSAWLVTLADHPTGERQITWLAGLLAARGMPSYLLEVNLGHLHEALVAAVPVRRARYERLLDLAAGLRERRTAALDAARFDDLARGFPFDAPVAGMGAVLVAAVVDEANDFKNALSSVRSWATDPERFDPAWIEAVDALVAETKRAIAEAE